MEISLYQKSTGTYFEATYVYILYLYTFTFLYWLKINNLESSLAI